MRIFNIILIAIVLSSCSANWHLKKFVKKGGTFPKDSTIESSVDTSFTVDTTAESRVDQGYIMHCNSLGELIIKLQDENGNLRALKAETIIQDRLVYQTLLDTISDSSFVLKIQVLNKMKLDSMAYILSSSEKVISEKAVLIEKVKKENDFWSTLATIVIFVAVSLFLILLMKIIKS